MDAWEKKLGIIWIIILSVATAVMLLLLLTGESSLNFTLVIFLMVVKFLAGFGTVIGITSAIIFVLTKFEKLFKGEEHKKNLQMLLIFMMIILIVLNIYNGPYKIVQSLLQQGGGDADNIFDKIMFVYGIVSLIFSLYIHPIWKGDFLAATMPTTKDNIKKGIKSASRGIKKRFFAWRKNYAKAELQEQLGMQEYLKRMRQQLAVIVLPFLGAGTIVFMVIGAIFIFIWLRVFVLKERKPLKLEFILLACACIGIAVIAALLPFIFDTTPLYLSMQSGYFGTYIANFTGLLIASIIYLWKMLGPVMTKRKKQHAKDLKEKKEELEKEHKTLQKEHKKLKRDSRKESDS